VVTAAATERERRVLAAASTGGHLSELYRLLPRMLPEGAGIDWVTFDTPQSRSLLAGERVRFVRGIRPRQVKSVIADARPAVATLRHRRYSAVVASGAIALNFLPVARAFGIAAHFIEAATRTEGPSLSGVLLGAVPGVCRYTQHPGWAGGAWLYRGSVFDSFEPVSQHGQARLDRIVVTLGMNPYPFRRLLERLIAILPPSAEVVWQTGMTDAAGLPIHAQRALPSRELDEAIASADVVVAHAGTGSALAALDAGRIPVLVPRRQAHGEQIDDHQVELARDLEERGLAIVSAVEDLDLETLRRANGVGARRRADLPRFELA
jgi:UDP-N-acetylglucosamine--N-acetylmuramyl-(pentapeptide) pyrophosphoryl-undecaprenol N-acetylglucosamine transferase